MTRMAGWIAASFVVLAAARGDEPTAPKVAGRVVEGTIVAPDGAPVSGARVLFGPQAHGLQFVDDATATTDARGRYKADMSAFPWSAAKTRAMILAPGFKATERILEAGSGAATADARLEPQPWRETEIRTEDASGRAVPGVTITCKVAGATWSTLRSDANGRCRLSMARAMPLTMSARPEGARPVDMFLGGSENEPAVITVPILPPLRGRVVDPQGRPVPDVAVGRWVSFRDDAGEVLPYWRGAKAVTDREGRFTISPALMLHGDESAKAREGWIHSVCFADASFRRIAAQTFRPLNQVEPIEVVLRPTRRVRVPITRGSITSGGELSSTISIRPRPDADLLLISRSPGPNKKASSPAAEAFVEEYLPPGNYRLEVDLSEAKTNKTLGEGSCELVVPAGDGPLDLPPLRLELPHFRKMVGKAAPEIEATDLDGKPVTLADLRGQVVVLDFWGYWCGPCIWNMPSLVELQRKFEGRPLTIVAFHDASARSRAEYNQKTTMARERIWGGRDLPLRVLLDRHDPENADDENPTGSGATVGRYGITGFPTTLVIDHEGMMVEKVGHTEHERLEALIKSLVEKAEEARRR